MAISAIVKAQKRRHVTVTYDAHAVTGTQPPSGYQQIHPGYIASILLYANIISCLSSQYLITSHSLKCEVLLFSQATAMITFGIIITAITFSSRKQRTRVAF